MTDLYERAREKRECWIREAEENHRRVMRRLGIIEAILRASQFIILAAGYALTVMYYQPIITLFT